MQDFNSIFTLWYCYLYLSRISEYFFHQQYYRSIIISLISCTTQKPALILHETLRSHCRNHESSLPS